MRLRPLIPVLLVAVLGAAETFDDMLKRTDLRDAEQVFALAQWCQENRLPSKAKQYFNLTIKLDKDHDGARTALGMVRIGDKWIHKSLVDAKRSGVPGGTAAGDPQEGGDAGSAGNGPTAEQVAWDLTPPPMAKEGEDNAFVDRYLGEMPKVGNDSDAMSVAVRTLIREDVWPDAFPRLVRRLLDPAYGDLYGPSEMVIELWRSERKDDARRLLPFVAKASATATQAEDLAWFCSACAELRDRRAVPRLIELLASQDEAVRGAAQDAMSAISLLPADGITAESAKSWWNRYHNVPEDRIWREQLRNADPLVAVEAAAGLCERRDPEIFPALIKLLRSDQRRVW